MLTAELNLFLAIGLIIALWHWSGNGREAAGRAAARVCTDLGFQHLDGAVRLSGLRLDRGRPRMRLVRVYRFEYSVAGVERHDGEVALNGLKPLWARLHDGSAVVHIGLE